MSGAAAGAAQASVGWPGALLLVLAGVLSAFHVGKPSAVLQALQTDLGMGIGEAAWLVSASGLLGAAAGAAVGLAVDRAGARRMTVVGLAIQACASAAGALATQPAWLVASRVAEGLGFQLVVVAAPALIATTMRERSRTTAMAAWSTFMPVGMAGALLSVAWLGPSTWKGLWWAGAALTFAAAVAVRAALPESPCAGVTAAPSFGRDMAVAWRARGPMLLALLFGLFNASYFAVFGFLPMLLEQASQAISAPAYLLSAIAVGASALGNLAGLALLARGLRPACLLAWSFVALAACSAPILLELATDARLRLGASIAFGVVAGLIPPALFAEAPARTPRNGMQGLILGLMMQGGNVGMSAGPLLAGMAASALGWHAVMAVVAVLAATAIATVRMLPGSRRSAAAAQGSRPAPSVRA